MQTSSSNLEDAVEGQRGEEAPRGCGWGEEVEWELTPQVGESEEQIWVKSASGWEMGANPLCTLMEVLKSVSGVCV